MTTTTVPILGQDPSTQGRVALPLPYEYGLEAIVAYSQGRLWENLRWWAGNDTNDIASGVDAQIEAFDRCEYPLRPHPSYLMIPGATAGELRTAFTTGRGKDFVGDLMKYKRARVGRIEVGDTVHVKEHNGGSSGEMLGGQYQVLGVDDGPGWIHLPHSNGVYSSYGEPTYVFQRHHLLLVAKKADEVPDEPVTETNALDRVAQLERDLAAAKAAHEADIRLVERVLKAEARSRQWCGEYEEVVSQRLNPRLSVGMSIQAARMYRVQWTERYYLDIARSVWVETDDPDSAREKAEEEWTKASDQAIAYQILSRVDPQLVDEDRDMDVDRWDEEPSDEECTYFDREDSDNYQARVDRDTSTP